MNQAAIAREAVLLFANQEQQEPLATYPADSPSIYDLSQAKPGTIIRIEFNTMSFYSGMPGRDKYAWFTTGGIRMEKLLFTGLSSERIQMRLFLYPELLNYNSQIVGIYRKLSLANMNLQSKMLFLSFMRKYLFHHLF